jgi:hypothetical protein
MSNGMSSTRSRMQQLSVLWSFRLGILAVLCMILAGVEGRGNIRQKEDATNAPEAKAKPGAAEMKRLGFYVGQWTYTETYPKSAFMPQGGVNHGIYTSKLGPGGNSLLNTFHSEGPVGVFEGMLVYTWDMSDGKYKAYVFGDGFPGALIETGQFEGEKLVFHGEVGAGAGRVQMRNVTWMAAPGKLMSEAYMSAAGAPETLLVRVEATKE